MISLSTLSAIIFIQVNLVFIILFIVWFLKHKKLKSQLSNSISVKSKLNESFNAIKAEHDKLKSELSILNAIKTIDDVFTEEIKLNRDKRDSNYGATNTVHYAHIYELRGIYLQLEKNWLTIEDKNEQYWKNIYGELNELLKQNILLNQVFSIDVEESSNSDTEDENVDEEKISNNEAPEEQIPEAQVETDPKSNESKEQ